MTRFPSISEVPPLVAEAMALAEQMGFERSCSPETGRLLHVLAAQIQSGVAGEIGTGCGVGAFWIVTGLRPDVSFVTVEIDETLAQAAQKLLERVPQARVIRGDWRKILPHGPFALLFADAAAAKQHEPETLLEALRPGGLIVLDDLTPEEQRPPEWEGWPDPVREFWLKDPRVIATQVLVRATEAVILGVRQRPRDL